MKYHIFILYILIIILFLGIFARINEVEEIQTQLIFTQSCVSSDNIRQCVDNLIQSKKELDTEYKQSK